VFPAVGLALGDLDQVLCTVIGISTLLASSAVIFRIVKYAGAAYLIALGLYRLVARRTNSSSVSAVKSPNGDRSRSLVIQAFFALNPKTAVFFLALFPQFVAEKAGPAWLQILIFGCTFVLLGFVTNSLYGFLSGTLSAIGRQGHRFQLATRYVSGFVLIGMGISAALL